MVSDRIINKQLYWLKLTTSNMVTKAFNKGIAALTKAGDSVDAKKLSSAV